MNLNYLIVLFKNKTKKRIIKKFVNYDKAKFFFDKLKRESSEVIFNKEYESGKVCDYEIGLVTKNKDFVERIYIKDEYGRNIKSKLEDDEMSLVEISVFKKEEKFFDLQKSKKISTAEFISRYINGQSIKLISSLNNKIVVQENENNFLFSFKNEKESSRFLDCLSLYLFKEKKNNCIIVKNQTSPQKKYLMDILSCSGIDKKVLYRKFTTYPRSK